MAAEILRQHKVNQGAFHTMHNTDLALTKQIISVFDGLYLKGIETRNVKLLGVQSSSNISTTTMARSTNSILMKMTRK